MRYILLLLALPLLAQAETKEQQCARLTKVASELEKMIQTKIIGPTCTDLPKSSLTNFDYRCKDLASVEMQLRSIENEIAMFKGANNLRDETIKAKETLDNSKNKAAAIDASQNLLKNLRIVTTIEGFLKTVGAAKNENLLTVLAKAKDEDFADPKKFSALVSDTCGKIGVLKGSSKICDNTQGFSDEEMKEVNGLLLLARRTERKFDKSQIEDLEKAIAIKDGDKPYSFTKMLSEVTAPGANEAFSEKDMGTLASIKINLDAERYSFLKNVRDSSVALEKTKALSRAQALPTRYQDLFDSLKRREEWELKSKLTVVLNELQGDIPEAAKDACTKARALGSADVNACLEALANDPKLPSKQKSSASNILDELKIGLHHIEKIDKLMVACAPNTEDMSLSKDCDAYLDQNLETLTKKADELHAIRDQILKGSENLILTRDLAIETIHSKDCMGKNPVIITCEQDIGDISREAVALSDAAGEIVFVFNKPTQPTDVENLCKNLPKEATHSLEVCKIALEKATEKVNRKVASNDDYMGPTEAPNNGRNAAGQAWADLLGGVAQAAGNFFAPNQQIMNPYASMYPYSPMVGQPMDIKNRIMDPYMVSGFGSYSTTPGLRPYSSVNSNVGTASAYSFGSSTFFNSPVGW